MVLIKNENYMEEFLYSRGITNKRYIQFFITLIDLISREEQSTGLAKMFLSKRIAKELTNMRNELTLKILA